MATENLVTAVGTTTVDGETKVRFTADLVTRSKAWSRNGVEVDFVTLPEPMTRLEALYFIQERPEFQTPDRERAILEQIILKETIVKRDERRIKRQAKRAANEALINTVVKRASITAKNLSLDEIRARKTQAETVEF